MNYRAVRGTRDILPPESEDWDIVLNKLIQISKNYGYKKVIFPTFESTELFKRGIGEDTDIVQKEMYTFQDRKGRWLTLRPEGTASVARLFVEKAFDKIDNITKYYYYGSMYRYERPQAGRFREFFQFGLEALGSDSPYLDVEMISLSCAFLEAFKLNNYTVLMNSIGCQACRQNYLRNLRTHLQEKIHLFCDDCQRRLDDNTLRILDCKTDTRFKDELPKLSDYICTPCKDHFDQVKKGLNDNRVKWLENSNLVRGLDYYNRTVFELTIPLFSDSISILGGGRYDSLIANLGGRETPAVGFALGLDRLYQSIIAGNKEFFTNIREGIFIASPENDNLEKVFNLTTNLRRRNIKADCNYINKSLKSQIKSAVKDNYKYFLIVFENDFVLRDLDSGEETIFNFQEEDNFYQTIDRIAKKQ